MALELEESAMTVRELIEKLQRLSPDARVLVSLGVQGAVPIQHVDYEWSGIAGPDPATNTVIIE